MSTAKNSTAIILHGLGDSSDGWSFLAEQFGPKMPWVRCFPDAPRQSVTLNMGMVMPAWFDLYGLDPNSKEDEAGLLRSVETVRAIIKKEIDSGIPPERIIVGGFSQGAAISILTGLMSQEKLAGVVSLSGFLTLSKKIKDMKGPFVEDLPLLWCHGTDDPVVRYQWGETSVNFLKNDLGMKNVEFKSYPGMVHSASPQELKDLFVWLNNRIPNK
ncbi:lysophospholipase [Phakopsora pachyrhizi]|uniref:Acyl-protein thioesterase 1 n=1 Tax=Phakopsora pachyrhizi TaxID=170000 RepID=A0AAV0AH07_PHAPC|nr:lysophospholipase [Phakopsora pachyrhizi]CAH7666572.1 lysophospholipase [Phakopsora pachyrhizi]